MVIPVCTLIPNGIYKKKESCVFLTFISSRCKHSLSDSCCLLFSAAAWLWPEDMWMRLISKHRWKKERKNKRKKGRKRKTTCIMWFKDGLSSQSNSWSPVVKTEFRALSTSHWMCLSGFYFSTSQHRKTVWEVAAYRRETARSNSEEVALRRVELQASGRMSAHLLQAICHFKWSLSY